MHVVTSGKVTLGQVMVKGRGWRTDDKRDILQQCTVMCYSLPIFLILNCQIICTFGRGTNDNTVTFCTSGQCVVQRPTGLYPRHGVLF